MYYYPYHYYSINPPPAYGPYRQGPTVDPSLLYQSANHTKLLMKEASMVLDRLSESKEFDTKLMYAAQTSDIEEVKRLIHSLGVTSNVDVHINPDGLRLEFTSTVDNVECCKLLVALRWR